MPAPITFALPKGRILAEALPRLAAAGIRPEPAFHDEGNRALRFATSRDDVELIRVRAFDVATFVAHGAAQIGICGSDVIDEHGYSSLYAPVDLGIGRCRLSLASPAGAGRIDADASHVRVATKYPATARRWFAARGLQAECIELSGAMELAPGLGLADRIVDLVSSGRTLRDNGLVEDEVIGEVSARLIINRTAFKTMSDRLPALVEAFRLAASASLEAAA